MSTASRQRGAPSPARTVAVASTALVLTAPGQTAAISVLVNPIQQELGLSEADVAAAYLVGTLAGACVLPLVGRAVDRWGPRLVMAGVGAAFGLVLLALSTVSGLTGLTAGFVGLRLLGQGALSLIATTTVALFVEHRRGFAQGITAAIGGAGISLTPVLLEGAAREHGFRAIWFWEGIVVLALVVPLALVGLPRRGRRNSDPLTAAVGDDLDEPMHVAPSIGAPALVPGAASGADWTLREAMRTAMFWLVTAGVAVTGTLGTALAYHQIDILGERGLSSAEAAANFLPQTAAGLVATVLVGYLADRIEDRVLIAGALLILAGAVLSAGFVEPGWTVLGYAVAAGTAGNAVRTLEATAFPACFGLAHIATIRGVVHAVAVAATAAGPFLFALARSSTESYRPVLAVAATVPVALAVVAPFVPRPQRSSPAAVAGKGVNGSGSGPVS